MARKKPMRKTCQVCLTGTVAGLLEGMAQTGFQVRELGESVNVWKRMLADPDCTIFFELLKTMLPAGMQRCFVEMAL
jgi:deoxyhypusine synthase